MNIEVILLREPPVWLDFLLKGTADGISSVSPFVERLVRFTWGPFEPVSDQVPIECQDSINILILKFRQLDSSTIDGNAT